MYYDDKISALENITGSIKVFQGIFTFIMVGCFVLIAFQIMGSVFTLMGIIKLGSTLLLLTGLVPLKTSTAVFIIFVLYLAGKITVVIEGFAKLQAPNYIAGSREGRKEPTL